MRRMVRGLITVSVLVPLITAGMAAMASAADGRPGTPSGPPPTANGVSVWCVSTEGAKACFAAYGDRVWVKDTKANGAPAAGTIKEAVAPSDWWRGCFNHRGADGGWVMCNFNVPEYQKGRLYAINNPYIGNTSNKIIWTSRYI